jgi:hypothetical protein
VVKNIGYGIGNMKITTIFALSDNKLTKFAAKKARFSGQELTLKIIAQEKP